MQPIGRNEYEKWISSIPDGICVFCHPQKYKQIVLKEGKNWTWIVALAPYWKYHTIIIPRKHYTDIDEIPNLEFAEMISLFRYARNKFLNANFTYDDGTPIYQYLFFWRIRDASKIDLVHAKKPSHFHLHLTPDRDHLIDLIMDKQAYNFDVSKLL